MSTKPASPPAFVVLYRGFMAVKEMYIDKYTSYFISSLHSRL